MNSTLKPLVVALGLMVFTMLMLWAVSSDRWWSTHDRISFSEFLTRLEAGEVEDEVRIAGNEIAGALRGSKGRFKTCLPPRTALPNLGQHGIRRATITSGSPSGC